MSTTGINGGREVLEVIASSYAMQSPDGALGWAPESHGYNPPDA
jgi:hypothetical protein